MNGFSNENVDTNRQTLNFGEEDQMELRGYQKDKSRNALILILCFVTLGTLRLYLHWYPHLLLKWTHRLCPLEIAEKVLVVENYKGKYKTYFVEKIIKLSDEYGTNLKYYTSDGLTETAFVKIFECKKVKYAWDTKRKCFIKLTGIEHGLTRADFHHFEGFGEKEQNLRQKVYGSNEIDVPLKSIGALFITEALTPFYVFQLFSLIVWAAEKYYWYGIAIIIMSVFGIGSSIIQTRKNQKNLRGTVHQVDTVQVKRAGNYVELPTTSLVPGDVIVISDDGCILHCDAVLLNGNCVVNESMLTGESVPVLKTPLPDTSDAFQMKNAGNHVLFCGTNVIQTRNHGESKVLAVVIRTGFLTTKGQLVKSIMYPPPADFKFDQDSYKFIAILAVIAVIGVIYTVVSKSSRNISAWDIIIKALDTITIIIPPALPAAMTVGKLYATSRLKTRDIFCINSRIINVTGSVNCICFDKTGTLTEDGLDMRGVVEIHDGLLTEAKDAERLDPNSRLCRGMATCHSLSLIGGKVEGDPLDVKMFESTNCRLDDRKMTFDFPISGIISPNNELSPTLIIVHQNQFSSDLQRMSTVIIESQAQAQTQPVLYCKGSPEMIAALSKPSTVPRNLEQELSGYTRKGYRVIAMATKTLDDDLTNIRISKREHLERDLIFLGLIILENKLKVETTPTIKLLKDANMKIVMITGDNIQTALSVAKECGIIDTSRTVIDVTAEETCDKNSSATIKYTVISQGDQGKEVLKICDVENGLNLGPKTNVDLAMTGTTWAILRRHFASDLAGFARSGTVFARMSSDQKQQLVEELQELGNYVAMCGDGTNDCGALKAAHVGISLSEAESSVASPFTSRTPNISCVPEIIKEGRAALSTSFGIFKFMISYSLTEYCSVLILYSIDSNLTDLQFLFIDICLVVFFASLFGKTRAYSKKLHRQPPMTSLLDLTPLASIGLAVVNVIAFQTLAYFTIQTYDWFKPFSYVPDSLIYTCYENYAVFSVSLFQYITLAVIFSKGRPYRKPIYTNKLFTFVLLLMTAVCIYIVYAPADWIVNALELLIPPEPNGRYSMLVISLIYFILAYLLEALIVDYIIGRIIQPKLKKKTPIVSKLPVEHAHDNVAFESEKF